MNLSDTFYIALCMTVLILGAVYWFWTQNQFMLRKINLLENIVYEMKAMLPQSPEPAGDTTELKPSDYPPAPSSELGEDEDLLHEELHAEVSAAPAQESPSPMQFVDNEPVPAPSTLDIQPMPDDLQPGGVGSGVPVATAKEGSGLLESMTLKELRRMADQRGVSGSSTMRKQALIDALKAEVPPKATVAPFEANEGIIDLN